MTASSSGETVRVVAAVIQRDGRYLVAQRPTDKRHGGLFEFPGGKVDAGESDLDAIRRELREELGVDVVTAAAPIAELADPASPFVIVFLPVQIAGEPLAVEHLQVVWADGEELARLPLAPSDRRFVAMWVGGEVAGTGA